MLKIYYLFLFDLELSENTTLYVIFWDCPPSAQIMFKESSTWQVVVVHTCSLLDRTFDC